MPDLLDSFIAGVPNSRPGAPSVFGRDAVSIVDADRLTRQRVSDRGMILDTRNKLAELRDKETARIQGQAALRDLSTLDPVTDPDYGQKVAQIISRNPNATLDQTVSNFLQIQGGLFDRADKERQDAQEFEAKRLLEAEDRRLMLESEKSRLNQEVGIRRDAKLEDEIANLPASDLIRFSKYREQGLDPTGALSMVKEDQAAATTLQELVELGYDPEGPEIMGAPGPDGKPLVRGAFDPKTGLIDPKQVAILKGQAARKKAEQEDADRRRRQEDIDLRNLQTIAKSAENSGDSATQESATKAIAKIMQSRGLLTTGDSGKVEDAGAMKDTTKVVPTKRPDISDSDRYIPVR